MPAFVTALCLSTRRNALSCRVSGVSAPRCALDSGRSSPAPTGTGPHETAYRCGRAQVCELAKVRQVTAVLLIFKHVCNAAKVVRRVRWRWYRARQVNFEAERLVGK